MSSLIPQKKGFDALITTQKKNRTRLDELFGTKLDLTIKGVIKNWTLFTVFPDFFLTSTKQGQFLLQWNQ